MTAEVTPIFKNIDTKIHEIIGQAKESIYLASAYFTDDGLFDVLIKKAQSGVTVSLIISESAINFKNIKISYSRVQSEENISVYLCNKNMGEGIMHNKFIVIDDNITLTGSYNLTKRAKNNIESVLIIKSDQIARCYLEEFDIIVNQFCTKPKNFSSPGSLAVTTGLYELDDIMNISSTDCILLSGPSQMGQYDLALNIVNSNLEHQLSVVYVGNRVSSKRMIQKLVNIRADFKFAWSRKENDATESARLNTLQSIHDLDLRDIESDNFYSVKQQLEELNLKRPINLIWFDDFRYFKNGYGDFVSEEAVIEDISNMSKEIRIPIIVTKDLPHTKNTRPLSIHSLPKSIENIYPYFSKIIYTYRPSYYKIYEDSSGNNLANSIELLTLKNSDGPLENISLNYDIDTGKIWKGQERDFVSTGHLGSKLPSVLNTDDDIPF